MPIYTKKGDSGKTSLFDGTRVAKNNPRVDTYGTIDELNSQIGVVIAHLGDKEYEKALREVLWAIQDDLLHIASLLANPQAIVPKTFVQHMLTQVSHFEKEIDTMTEEMPRLRNFIFPGGDKVAAFLHMTRTIARRVERKLAGLNSTQKEKAILIYFNRLSDLFFTQSRYVNFKEKKQETIWHSG
ncbi:MAG TPA: cob(I)yrinic acid a,c-diamide adenosyltransferase [Patescibacteria group bacterium]|nr:cob(I)yrinic acid a,c-diamide adenosyltransferase [Patescibacteria group bacterium]